jgi:hypothetical protein
MVSTLQATLALASENGRVCPKPSSWARLFELLPNKRSDAYGSIPAAPLLLSAWSESSDVQKVLRLREHLEWADRHAGLPAVHAFLLKLPESEWHHVGE